ncbi:SDR family NAD(P)-dependent oxidoreductase [Ruegeria atlantica]|uniref:SDR family NAD(P)-dependent oxidoreductase n=1 Tax=Ruegeria atlantica TaxID=81569 RepID=UPI001481B838|nr:SDR family oxidoreductase [Ruegeria atlantica]
MSKRILVIGGTSQIGQALVKRLTDRGDKVVFNGRNQDVGASLGKETGASFFQCDYENTGAAEHIVGQSVSILNGLDGLVLAGGALHVARASETTDEAWDSVLRANLFGPFLIARAAMWELSKDSGGAIVTVASGVAQRAEVELAAYSVAKRAVHWMTSMLAIEGAPKGVAAYTVNPGDLSGGMQTVINQPQARDLGAPFIPPAGRLTEAEDVALSIQFLLDSGPALTGATLTIDGGLRSALRASKVHQP